MQVHENYIYPGVPANLFFTALALNNDTYLQAQSKWQPQTEFESISENQTQIQHPPPAQKAELTISEKDNNNLCFQGEPTEKALCEFAAQQGYFKGALEKIWPRTGEIPFSSERATMTTYHQTPQGLTLGFIKGAPEKILALLTNSESIQWTTNLVDDMTHKGLRVLAFAQQKEDLNSSWELLGLVGLMDPPRPEVPAVIQECQKASIKVVMITGDHPATARTIAQQLGILSPTMTASLITGPELQSLSESDLQEKIETLRVYARVSPEQKIRIVQALQKKGEFVAMTGDGVNDAPAIQKAEIGIAMGKMGTDVARESSAMVLMDDRFTTIVDAIREGRRIYDNIRKFIRYALSTNLGEVGTLMLAPLFGLPIPLLPIHILWINLLTDGLPGLALASEKADSEIMNRSPLPPQESLFARGLWQHILWVGGFLTATNLLVVAWALQSGRAHWQSMVLTVTTFSQMGHVWAIRSERKSSWSVGLLSNIPLLGAVLVTLSLQLAILYIPLFNDIFKTSPLSASEMGICIAASSLLFFAAEGEKFLLRRGFLYYS